MGFIADLTRSKQSFGGNSPGDALWRQVFGEDKEKPNRQQLKPTYSRNLAGDAAFMRLLQALRSKSPGGWTDDRYEQSKHFVGVQYICFPPGTRVRMADGTHKPIEKIALRENVVTAEGNVHRVEHCFTRKYEGDLINLGLWGHRHLKMTPNHEVLTRRGYVSADKLTKEDWVAIPRYMPEKNTVLQTAEHIYGEHCTTKSFFPDKIYGRKARTMLATAGVPWTQYRPVPDLIELTPEFGRIVGLYLAEAHTTSSGEITWSFNAVTEKDSLIAELVGLLRNFGFDPCVSIPKYNRSVMQVTVCGKLWVRLFHSLCGKGAGAKTLHPDLLAGPDEFLRAVLNGWLAGDGCLEKGKYVEATVSHDMALNMFDIGNKFGLRPALMRQEPHQKPILKQTYKKPYRPVWKVFFRAMSDNYRIEMDDKHVWRKVDGIGREAYSGDVFNIEVATDQSYVAEGIGVHNCLHRCGEQYAQSEFQVMEKDDAHPDGKKQVGKGHPGYGLVELLEKPNSTDSFGDWMYNCSLQMGLTGKALTLMVPNMLGDKIIELYSIPTATAIPQPQMNADYPEGYYRIQPLYPYGPFSSYPTPSTAVGAPIGAQWMMEFKYPHPLLRYDGYSPLTALRLHLDEIESMDRSRWYKMLRTVDPDAVLSFDEMEGMQPLPEPEIERMRVEFANQFQGPENAGRLFVTPPGGKLDPWGSPPKDMEYQAGWEQLTSFAMAGFGITKPAAGMVEDSSYSTLFATLKQLHLLTLQPQCNRIAAQLTRRLAPFFGKDLIVEIRCPRIDDHDVANGQMNVLISGKAITKNELRKKMGLSATKEEWGEEIAGAEAKQAGWMEAPQIPGQEQLPREEPMEVTQSRPNPGNLSVGALGPRKVLNGFRRK